jgi:hypothetical protein
MEQDRSASGRSPGAALAVSDPAMRLPTAGSPA